MIGFLIKKSFYDSWDNLFRLASINIGFIAFIAIPVFIPHLLGSVTILSISVMVIGILWCFIYFAAASFTVKSVSDYKTFGFKDFTQNLKRAWLPGLIMGGFAALFVLLIAIAIPFYLSIGSVVGLLLASVVFWTMIVCIVALQFFLAIVGRLDGNILKALRKCFIIFFDNPLFCIFSLIYSVIIIALSTFLGLVFPGPAGLLLFLDEGLRLRLLKYDYLEENPEANRKDIPWDTLLIDDRDKTGSRTLRNFIFPWKY